jgi:anaerobic selenocysteine-containing dehydrogenase
MRVSRRGLLKITGATTSGVILSSLGFSFKTAQAQALDLKIKYATEITSSILRARIASDMCRLEQRPL